MGTPASTQSGNKNLTPRTFEKQTFLRIGAERQVPPAKHEGGYGKLRGYYRGYGATTEGTGNYLRLRARGTTSYD